MTDATNTPDFQTEGSHRLHSTVRALLSPGIWLVLVAQLALVFSVQWRMPENASPLASALTIFLTSAILLLFFYLQAGTFHAVTLGRGSLSVAEIARAGKVVFPTFLWLTFKAGLLLVVIVNLLLYLALLVTGYDLKTMIDAFYPYFSPVAGLLAFVFVYWLPLVFVRRDFRLLPSLKAALAMAWTRLSHSAFLALLVLAPVLVSALLPADGPVWLDLLLSTMGGLMGWIAYVYCVEVLQEGFSGVSPGTPA